MGSIWTRVKAVTESFSSVTVFCQNKSIWNSPGSTIFWHLIFPGIKKTYLKMG